MVAGSQFIYVLVVVGREDNPIPTPSLILNLRRLHHPSLQGVVSCWEYHNVPAMPGTSKDDEGDVWNRVGVALLAPLWLRAVGHVIYDLVVGSMFSGKVRSVFF